jgi:hypothetical protein
MSKPDTVFFALTWTGVADTLGAGVADCAVMRARTGAGATMGTTTAARKREARIARDNRWLVTRDIYPRRPPSLNIWFRPS